MEVNLKETLIRILKTIIFTYLTTIVLLLILTLIFYKFQIKDAMLTVGVCVVYFLSTFVGGFILGKMSGRKKYLYGLMVGGIYFSVLLIISLIVSPEFSFASKDTLISLILCGAGGMVGGMLG